jgi:hypothetical protein
MAQDPLFKKFSRMLLKVRGPASPHDSGPKPPRDLFSETWRGSAWPSHNEHRMLQPCMTMHAFYLLLLLPTKNPVFLASSRPLAAARPAARPPVWRAACLQCRSIAGNRELAYLCCTCLIAACACGSIAVQDHMHASCIHSSDPSASVLTHAAAASFLHGVVSCTGDPHSCCCDALFFFLRWVLAPSPCECARPAVQYINRRVAMAGPGAYLGGGHKDRPCGL